MDRAPRRRLMWDSCVLCRYLTETPPDCVGDIAQYLHEASSDDDRYDTEIFFSTILLAEVRPSLLKKKGHATFNDLQANLQGALRPIAPNTNILMMAASLRDHSFKLAKMQKNQKERVLCVPDSIHLATAIYARDALEIEGIEFHTFDDGNARNIEGGRNVPLLSFNDWSEHLAKDPIVAAVRKLTISQPLHPEPELTPTAGSA